MLHTKHDEPCLLKAADDEPIWVLRGQDLCTPQTIRAWAAGANARGAPYAKVQEASRNADEIEQWQRDHPDRVKLPD